MNKRCKTLQRRKREGKRERKKKKLAEGEGHDSSLTSQKKAWAKSV